jgi:WD40 repeat protein
VEQPVPEKKTGRRKPEPETQGKLLAVLERKLIGHKWVNSVAVSPDGKWAASGAGSSHERNDWTVKIWDLDTGECRKTLEGHNDEVRSVAITPDGKRILSGSFDKTVRVWDAISGREVAKLKGHTDGIWTVIALWDNAHGLSGGYDGTLKLWDLASGTCLKTIACGTVVLSGAVNTAGNRALSGHGDLSVRHWNLETGECLAVLKGHSGFVDSVRITPDERFAVSSSEDKTVKVWDLKTRTCVGTLEGHRNSVMSVAISPDGTLIASTGFIDDTVRLWDLKSGACLQVIKLEATECPISVAFSPDGLRLVVGTTGGSIMVYRLSRVRTAPPAEPARRYVNAKVVLLGEGTVGKTSLAYRLIEDKYVVKDRTHGMNVWPLELPLPSDATLDREALLWDLAGQEDYRLIHRLFLDETALALLLINPQKDDSFAEAGDWLKALDTACNG